ncbi:hypothetical protein EYF80_051661 [Liparis tanakae]|uniref:Uncharacterized protein n=1 Tax=Liparis tanakae TaxID=230148 RepID=A0A4Z2FAF3_9TELE|nr:hypothetical protein EYF80_051661 [Liparis tanakae]
MKLEDGNILLQQPQSDTEEFLSRWLQPPSHTTTTTSTTSTTSISSTTSTISTSTSSTSTTSTTSTTSSCSTGRRSPRVRPADASRRLRLHFQPFISLRRLTLVPVTGVEGAGLWTGMTGVDDSPSSGLVSLTGEGGGEL